MLNLSQHFMIVIPPPAGGGIYLYRFRIPPEADRQVRNDNIISRNPPLLTP